MDAEEIHLAMRGQVQKHPGTHSELNAGIPRKSFEQEKQAQERRAQTQEGREAGPLSRTGFEQTPNSVRAMFEH